MSWPSRAWTQPLGAVQRALKADPALRAAALDRAAPCRPGWRLSNAVPGGLAGPLRQFLGTLLEAGQLDQLETILVEIERLVRRRAVRQVAQVTSAVPLTAQEQERCAPGSPEPLRGRPRVRVPCRSRGSGRGLPARRRPGDRRHRGGQAGPLRDRLAE
jgi:hypothetical protein